MRNAFGKPRHRWEENIRMDLRETCWKDVDWIHLVQDREQWRVFVEMVINIWDTQKVRNFLTTKSDSYLASQGGLKFHGFIYEVTGTVGQIRF
jgi:hypothetical protein